ncbi:MAG: hypothetical protein HOP19_15280 [Acidobacteria bacterium]|nr:hypothetical protein [Acidobacteriota bacterium]
MSYLTRLDALDFSHSLAAASVRSRAVLLTGQSSFCSSRLSDVQTDFLRAVAPPITEPLFTGFPYHPEFNRAEFNREEVEPNLLAASWRNGWQFAASLASVRWQHIVARALQPLFHRTDESLLIVTGSCGLQLLACAWPHLVKPENQIVSIAALGPVLWHPFTLDLREIFAVQSRADALSRFSYRGAVAAQCDGGHLDYWQSATARELVAQFFLTRGAA